jgi:ATP-dependent Zn protease
MVKEISLGLALALVIFLTFQGINIAPVFFFVIIGYALFRVMEKQGLGNKQGFDTYGGADNKVPGTSFDDIGGQKAAKNELLEALKFVKDINTVKELGIRP